MQLKVCLPTTPTFLIPILAWSSRMSSCFFRDWYCYNIWYKRVMMFILFRITSILHRSKFFECCSILQNKHLTYTESIENSRLNYIFKKHHYQSWLYSVHHILNEALRHEYEEIFDFKFMHNIFSLTMFESQSVKSLQNLWRNLCTMSFRLDINYCFTCG